MTDLKAANEALAKALAALESPEHDADVREAEACRNRLIELDERIGARIKAKLDAHREIADAWRAAEGQPIEYRVSWGKETSSVLETLAPECPTPLADAWQAHHEEHTGKYAMAGDEIPERVLTNGVAEMQQAETATES